MHHTEFSQSYSWPLVKYDADTGGIAATWSPENILAQDPQFIPNPNASSEDDGLLIVVGYNFQT